MVCIRGTVFDEETSNFKVSNITPMIALGHPNGLYQR